MPGRIVRTKTAERVSELLSSREGRQHLTNYGWVQGMPIVMSIPTEPLNDVMGLVSMHGCPVLVAMLSAKLDELKFLYVSTPNPALRNTAVEKDSTHIQDLFERAAEAGLVTFRAKYWDASSVAHPIPAFRPATESPTYAHRFSG